MTLDDLARLLGMTLPDKQKEPLSMIEEDHGEGEG
jgi:hypothetical protein